MEVKEITSREIWEQFLMGCREKTFLQSWNWGDAQKAMRGTIWRLGVFSQDGTLIAVALTVKVAARRGSFLLVPHGPVSMESTRPAGTTTSGEPVSRQEILTVLVEELKKIAREEGVGFIRINPIWKRTEEHTALFSSLRFRPAPIQMHPEASWKLDITPSEDELFRSMRKTTRYTIRQILKNPDITVRQSASLEDVALFSDMHVETSRRQKFVPFSQEYLKTEFSAFSQGDQIRLFLGYYKKELAAISFFVYWSGIGFYHHAASLPEFAKLSIPYRLQWEAILEGKRRGCYLHDFWGYVNPETQPNHPWAGPTLFKMGFGGQAHEYVKTQDLPLSRKYWITAGFERVRKIRRNL